MQLATSMTIGWMSSQLDMIDVAGVPKFSLAYEKNTQEVQALSPHLLYQFWERKVFKLSQNNSHVYRTSVSHEKKMDMFTPRYSAKYAHLKTGTHPYHFQVCG